MWTTILKADWRQMVNDMVDTNTDSEEIYKKIVSKLKFDSPSKKELNDYLKENFKQHPLWANLWSREK